MLIAMIAFSACTEDFKDWANPQSNAQGDPINKVAGVVKALQSEINYATASDKFDFIEFVAADVPEGATIKFTNVVINVEETETNIPFETLDNTLIVTKEDLNTAVRDAYHSMSDNMKELKIKVLGDVLTGGTALIAEMESNELTVKYTPKALPAEAQETEFYYVGGYNGWDLSPNNQQKLEDNGDGTYSIILEVPNAEYFKFAPKSAVMASDWDHVMGNSKSDGCTDNFGYFAINAGAMQVEEAGSYKFTVDRINWTYSVTPCVDLLWFAGDGNGWTFSQLAKQSAGVYSGFYYINNSGFKFPTENNWDAPQYGAGAADYQIALGGGNISLPAGVEEGMYEIIVDKNTNTYSLGTHITAVSLIGTVKGSWDTDVDLTWDNTAKAWMGKAELDAGEFKIRANHDWALSWGGDDPSALTSKNGANLTLDKAGEYTIVFTPNADGFGVVKLMQFVEYIYMPGNPQGWSPATAPALWSPGFDGVYNGFGYMDGDFKFTQVREWGAEYNYTHFTTYSDGLGAGEGTNINQSNPGYYFITADVPNAALTAVPVTFGLVGPATPAEWDASKYVVMDYDKKNDVWSITTALNVGEFKFTTNGSWDINLGGSADDLSLNGSNLNITEAGTYEIVLHASRTTTNKIYATITKK